MEHYIEKNILIDELLELEISYIHELLNIFEELRNTNDYKKDIDLFIRCMQIIDMIIWETNEYLKTIVYLEFEYNYVYNHLNNLYNGKNKIQNFINKINEIDIVSDLLSEINVK